MAEGEVKYHVLGCEWWPWERDFESKADLWTFYAALEALQGDGDIKPLEKYLLERRTPLSPGVAHALAHVISGEIFPPKAVVVGEEFFEPIGTRYSVEVKPHPPKHRPKKHTTPDKLYLAAREWIERTAKGEKLSIVKEDVIKKYGVNANELEKMRKRLEELDK